MKKLYDEASVRDIAEAIREKNGSTAGYKIAQMGAAVRAISGTETLEWHQCPEAVRRYLDAVSYDPTDYGTSQIAGYAPATALDANYRPIAGTLGGVAHCNEVPYSMTPYLNGAVKPLDRLRWIRTNAANVRDLGGWACDGGKVRYGLLFRGGEVTAKDRAVLVEELGIRHELNLRGYSEATQTRSPLGEDVYFTRDMDYAWYTLTPESTWRTNLRCVFDAVTHGEPVYFHCSAGADRTGTLACVLEGLLGMSQSDIDKDYELTCFYTGTSSDAYARRRNEAEWHGLINAINAKSGASFRDKCVTFAAELGFTAAEINAYRKAMIDGTPETVTPSVAACSVTYALTGASSGNADNSVTEYQPYETQISAANGYVISGVQVTMGGADITRRVWTGTVTDLYRRAAAQLTNCSSDNSAKTVIDGQSYAARIRADEGYTLDGAEINITMGGTDVSEYYSDGAIAIPQVTGDLVIRVTAVEQAAPYTNYADPASPDWVKDLRINSSGVLVSQPGGIVTNFFPLTKNDVLRFKNIDIGRGDGGAAGRIAFYLSKDEPSYFQFNPNGRESKYGYSVDEASGVTTLDVPTLFTGISASRDVAFARIAAISSPQRPIITVNEVIE